MPKEWPKRTPLPGPQNVGPGPLSDPIFAPPPPHFFLFCDADFVLIGVIFWSLGFSIQLSRHRAGAGTPALRIPVMAGMWARTVQRINFNHSPAYTLRQMCRFLASCAAAGLAGVAASRHSCATALGQLDRW